MGSPRPGETGSPHPTARGRAPHANDSAQHNLLICADMVRYLILKYLATVMRSVPAHAARSLARLCRATARRSSVARRGLRAGALGDVSRRARTSHLFISRRTRKLRRASEVLFAAARATAARVFARGSAAFSARGRGSARPSHTMKARAALVSECSDEGSVMRTGARPLGARGGLRLLFGVGRERGRREG